MLKLLWFSAVLYAQTPVKVKQREESDNQAAQPTEQDLEKEREQARQKEEERKATLANLTAVLLDFCSRKEFFEAGRQDSLKVDSMREFSQEMKRVANDLIFIEGGDELLKEAMIILKKSETNFQTKILLMVKELGTDNFDDLFQRVRLLKALMTVSKLG